MKFRKTAPIVAILLTAGIFLLAAGAGAFRSYPVSTPAQRLEWTDIDRLDRLPLSKSYTHAELLDLLADSGIPAEQAAGMIGELPAIPEGSSLRYGLFQMGCYTYKDRYQLLPCAVIGLEYREGQRTPSRILSLSEPQILAPDGAGHLFSGNTFTALYSGRSFYYDFNGEIHRATSAPRTQSHTMSAEGGVTVEISVSQDFDYVASLYDCGNYYSPLLEE